MINRELIGSKIGQPSIKGLPTGTAIGALEDTGGLQIRIIGADIKGRRVTGSDNQGTQPPIFRPNGCLLIDTRMGHACKIGPQIRVGTKNQ